MRSPTRWIVLLCAFALILSVSVAHAAASDAYRYGAWLPYWVADEPLTEAMALEGELDEVIAFACIFDRHNQPLMLAEADVLYDSLRDAFKDSDTRVYLSIVNDREIVEKQYENKSARLLRELLGDEKALENHLDALVKLIDDYKLSGLEIDYENLKDDAELWQDFVRFIEKISAQCAQDGVSLRVVLPYDAPRYAELPEGPEYSVMCYNLYGYHSGPGPKADLEMLRLVCELYQNVPGTVRMAFATGGFDWANGKVTALTQVEAVALLEKAGARAERDEDSGVLTASFSWDGVKHEVWYADGETLACWRDFCAGYGYEGYDLFRLGGNVLDDWQSALFSD